MSTISNSKKIGGSILIALLIAGLLYGGGSMLYERYRTVTYVIPAGTAATQGTVDIPTSIELTIGVKDVLVIDNQDEVIHSFGPFVVGPHSKFVQRFSRPMTFEGECSVHPDEGLTLTVHPAPWQ